MDPVGASGLILVFGMGPMSWTRGPKPGDPAGDMGLRTRDLEPGPGDPGRGTQALGPGPGTPGPGDPDQVVGVWKGSEKKTLIM